MQRRFSGGEDRGSHHRQCRVLGAADMNAARETPSAADYEFVHLQMTGDKRIKEPYDPKPVGVRVPGVNYDWGMCVLKKE